MFISQREEVCANLMPSTSYFTAATESENKTPKICLEVILKEPPPKHPTKKRVEVHSLEISKVNNILPVCNAIIELASCPHGKHFQRLLIRRESDTMKTTYIYVCVCVCM